MLRRSPSRLAVFAALALAGVAGCVLGVAASAEQGSGVQTPPPASQSVPEFMQWYQAQPRVNLPVAADGAVVLIVKFTDFQCPACGLTHGAYKPVLARFNAQYPGAVRMVSKDYPLNTDCNPGLVRTLHPGACDAAVAVRLAKARGRATELEDWLYSNQELLIPVTVRKAASLLADITPADFDAGYARTLDAVKADAVLGRSLGINSTPTFFINGVKVPKVMEPTLFEAAIAYELKKAGKIK